MASHYLLYGHGGSFNHGSEASVHCDIALLRRNFPGCKITLASHFPEQDRQFNLDADEIVGRDLTGRTNEEIYASAIERITPQTVCLSVGGDMYCYPNWQRYAAIHYAALERGARSILWSCSIEPSMLDEEMLRALRTHHLITAREQITFRALRERGLRNVVQTPDIAFSLAPRKTSFDPGGDYAALNLSPLVIRRNPVVLTAFRALVREILEQTDLKLVLVPHVLAPADNDQEALEALYPDEDRVWMVPTGLCAAELKDILSRARFCIASRTHACVAAYSSCVPVLAVGYSVKSAGIAADLGQEAFVLDIDSLDPEKLLAAYNRLREQEREIRKALAERLPAYLKTGSSHEILEALR